MVVDAAGCRDAAAGRRDRREAGSEAPRRRAARRPFPGPLDVQAWEGRDPDARREGLPRRAPGDGRAKALQVVDVVGLDNYLLGVVPGEMPKEWPAAALQAQAVAARSYALASLVKNRDFDLYADPRSQMYYGVAAESPATTAAVQATKGQILTYGGKVVMAFYYSSSGGRTASSADVFGLQLPYLQARRRPMGLALALPPLAPALVHGGLARAGVRPLGARRRRPGRADGLRPAGLGHAREEDGREHPAQGRRREGPPRPALDRVQDRRPARRAAPHCNARAGAPGRRLRRLARDVDAPLLEKLGANGAWLPSVRVDPDGDGAFAVTVRPKATSTYRLTAEGEPGPALTITVPAGQPK